MTDYQNTGLPTNLQAIVSAPFVIWEKSKGEHFE